MKLTDLNPKFLDSSEGQRGVAIEMDCPCGACGVRLPVPFDVGLDGAPTRYGDKGWHRTGDTFETLTLTPSILRPTPWHCGWHGYLTNGELRSC